MAEYRIAELDWATRIHITCEMMRPAGERGWVGHAAGPDLWRLAPASVRSARQSQRDTGCRAASAGATVCEHEGEVGLSAAFHRCTGHEPGQCAGHPEGPGTAVWDQRSLGFICFYLMWRVSLGTCVTSQQTRHSHNCICAWIGSTCWQARPAHSWGRRPRTQAPLPLCRETRSLLASCSARWLLCGW
jgi:hypothetical protein